MADCLIDLIRKHEGRELFPYKCSAGKLTIGYGRNLEDKGITAEEAFFLLQNDIAEVLAQLKSSLSFWNDLSHVRQAVLADMCYNLGLSGFLKFRRMIKALEDHNYELAAKEMMASTWATQVKGRANELVFMMIEDKYQGS